MGRYTYNATQVTQAIDELNDALSSLSNVTTEIQSGIDTINNSNGSNCIEIDYSKLLQLQTMAEEVIEEDIRTIQEKVTVIEDYENAPWYKKLFSSIGMGLTKFVEGIASGLENITDGAVSIVGFVGGIFNSDFKNSVAEYVATDHVGDWFDEQYDEGFLSGVSKYSWFSEDSTAANIFKGFGTAAPYIALSMTGVGTTFEMAAAALGGIGSGTEAGINKALTNDPNLTAGEAFNSAFGQGVVQGAKNAALVYVMNKVSQYAAEKANTPRLTDGTNPGQGLTTSEKVFSKTQSLAQTPAGQAINAVDETVANTLKAAGSKVTTVASKLPGASTASKIWKGVTTNKVVSGVTSAVKAAAKAHPGTAYAAAATVFALDQVDEDVINSQYRVQQEELGSVTVHTESPEITPTPTVNPTATVDPNITSTPSQTPTPTPSITVTSTPSPTSGNGGGGYSVTVTSTPAPTTTSTVAPTSTTTATATVTTTPTPTPTVTVTSTPTPTPSPTIGITKTTTPIPTQTIIDGGGYTEEGYTGEEGDTTVIPDSEDMSGSFSEIVGGNQYTNIPTSAAPITTTTTTGTKKSIIPVVAGLGAASIAGIGTKAFLDKKEENASEEEFDADEWTEEDSLDIDYNEAMEEDGDYLDPSDEYAYQEGEEEPSESYEAVNSSELASMQ